MVTAKRSPPAVMQHIVLTRFCCRAFPAFRAGAAFDPLEEAHVDRRLQLLATAPVPSLASQTTSAFTWVVVFDSELRPPLRAALEAAVGRVPGAVTMPLDARNGHEAFERFDLIAPFARDPGQPLITTWLDDDDALADHYIETVQREVAAGLDPENGPWALACGNEAVWQWDLCSTPRAPLGFRKPWSRPGHAGYRFILSPGCSIACLSPELGLSVNQWSHYVIAAAFGSSDEELAATPGPRAHIEKCRATVASAVTEWQRRTARRTPGVPFGYRRLDAAAGPRLAVMTNHLGNSETSRMLESPESRDVVVGSDSFPGVTLDFAAAQRILGQSRRSWRTVRRVAREAAKMARRTAKGGKASKAIAGWSAAARAVRDAWSLG